MIDPARAHAIIRLLDDEESTAGLVHAELLREGEAARPVLHAMLSTDCKNAARRVRHILADIDRATAITSFAGLCEAGDPVDLEKACMTLAVAINPSLDAGSATATLDDWGAEAKNFLSGPVLDPRQVVADLVRFLHGDLGLRGNAEDYYNPSNSLLPLVLATGLGIPISLTVVYMFVGARAGILIEGVNLPGHFLARFKGVLFDPFHGGRILGQEDLDRIAGEAARRGEKLTLRSLDATPRQILMRMIANLLNIFTQNSDPRMVDQLSAWLDRLGGR